MVQCVLKMCHFIRIETFLQKLVQRSFPLSLPFEDVVVVYPIFRGERHCPVTSGPFDVWVQSSVVNEQILAPCIENRLEFVLGNSHLIEIIMDIAHVVIKRLDPSDCHITERTIAITDE